MIFLDFCMIVIYNDVFFEMYMYLHRQATFSFYIVNVQKSNIYSEHGRETN